MTFDYPTCDYPHCARERVTGTLACWEHRSHLHCESCGTAEQTPPLWYNEYAARLCDNCAQEEAEGRAYAAVWGWA